MSSAARLPAGWVPPRRKDGRWAVADAARAARLLLDRELDAEDWERVMSAVEDAAFLAGVRRENAGG